MGRVRRSAFLKTVGSLAFLFLLAGCWDQVEIERRGFVVGISIDKGHKEDMTTASGAPSKSAPLYKATYQFIIPKPKRPVGGNLVGEGVSYYHVEATGTSLVSATRKISAKTSHIPYFEHVNLIVLSSEVISEPHQLGRIMDFYLRDREMRRSAKIIVTTGSAQELLKVKPVYSAQPADYLHLLIINRRRTARLPPAIDIGDIHEQLMHKESFLLPQVDLRNKEAGVMGSAVIQGTTGQLQGFLTMEETLGANLITGKMNGGDIPFMVEGIMSAFEIEKYETEVKAEVDKTTGKVKFKLTILAHGYIPESMGDLDWSDPAVKRERERKVAEEIQRLVMKAYFAGRDKLRTDVFGFSKYLRTRHFRYWQKIRDDWDDGERLFGKSELEVEVKTTIRRIGSVNFIEEEEE